MPTTTINSNGGGRALPLDALFERLASHPLDRTFEAPAFGAFIQHDPISVAGEAMTAPGGVHFFGNFFTYSHVFSILTDDQDLIERLTAAILVNQLRPDYLAQPPYFDSAKLKIVRHLQSITQGGTELVYDGRRLGRWSDDPTPNGRGAYEQRSGQFWLTFAKKFMADEHRAAQADRVAA